MQLARAGTEQTPSKAAPPLLATTVRATRYFFFPLTFAPIRNNFRTVPVGRLFI
jgi:hypothetical protein